MLPSTASRADMRGTKSSLLQVKLSSIQLAIRATLCRANARAGHDGIQRTVPSSLVTRAFRLPGGVMLPPSVVDTSRRGDRWPMLVADDRSERCSLCTVFMRLRPIFRSNGSTVMNEFVPLSRSVKCQIVQRTKCACITSASCSTFCEWEPTSLLGASVAKIFGTLQRCRAS